MSKVLFSSIARNGSGERAEVELTMEDAQRTHPEALERLLVQGGEITLTEDEAGFTSYQNFIEFMELIPQ